MPQVAVRMSASESRAIIQALQPELQRQISAPYPHVPNPPVSCPLSALVRARVGAPKVAYRNVAVLLPHQRQCYLMTGGMRRLRVLEHTLSQPALDGNILSLASLASPWLLLGPCTGTSFLMIED